MNDDKNKPQPITIAESAKDIAVYCITELFGGFIREVIIPKVKRLFGEKDDEDVDKPVVQVVGSSNTQETTREELDKTK